MDNDGGASMPGMLPLSALECGVCLSLVCQPVSLSCGHTFCRLCLMNTLQRNRKKCPTCRAVCHNSAEDQPEDVMIANIVRLCFPEFAEKRQREMEAERTALTAVLPIFYYNMPMFPGETLSLHLFEPRYKVMMQRIVNTSRRFAYVPNYTNYSANVGDVALAAEVTECEFLSAGRVLLSAKLASRETVVEHFIEEGTQGLHYCRIASRSDEDPSGDTSAMGEIAELHEKTRTLVSRIIAPIRAQICDRYGEIPTSAEGQSLWIASILPISAQEKHSLLAGTSTLSRLRNCKGHLEHVGGGPPPTPRERMPAAALAVAYERHLALGEAAQEVPAAPYAAEEGAEAGGNVDMSGVEETEAPRNGVHVATNLAEDTPNGEGVGTGIRSNGFEGEDFAGVTGEGVGNAGENQPQMMSVDGVESACGPDEESQVRGAR